MGIHKRRKMSTFAALVAFLFALMAPAMVVPTLLGVRLYSRFSEIGFRRLILILLSLSGVVLLLSSLPRLRLG